MYDLTRLKKNQPYTLQLQFSIYLCQFDEAQLIFPLSPSKVLTPK